MLPDLRTTIQLLVMKVAAISDLHGYLPPCESFGGVDLLLICGDLVPLQYQSHLELSKDWFLDEFSSWVNHLPVQKVLFIGGNHDWVCQYAFEWMEQTFNKETKATYLYHTDFTLTHENKQYHIFGTPFCKQFGKWAFMHDLEALDYLYGQIPENIDILISHDSPTLNKLGFINQPVPWGNVEAGNTVLSKHIQRIKPKYFFSGHIHSGNHTLECVDEVTMANVSIVDEYYQVAHQPLIIEVE